MNMKKGYSLLTTVLIIAVGCALAYVAMTASKNAAASQSIPSGVMPSTPVPNFSVGSEVVSYNIENETLSDVFSSFFNLRPGASGWAIRQTSAAAHLLDWVQQHITSEEDAMQKVKDAYYFYTQDKCDLLSEVYPDIHSTCEILVQNNNEAQLLLNDAGNPNQLDNYDKSLYEHFYKAMKETFSLKK